MSAKSRSLFVLGLVSLLAINGCRRGFNDVGGSRIASTEVRANPGITLDLKNNDDAFLAFVRDINDGAEGNPKLSASEVTLVLDLTRALSALGGLVDLFNGEKISASLTPGFQNEVQAFLDALAKRQIVNLPNDPSGERLHQLAQAELTRNSTLNERQKLTLRRIVGDWRDLLSLYARMREAKVTEKLSDRSRNALTVLGFK